MLSIAEDSILFEDSWVIAINKPSGLFTQAARGVPSLHEELIAFLNVRNATAEPPFVGLVHRLDRPTSGIVLFGLTSASVRQLNHQFRERTVSKSYLVIVEGIPDEVGQASDWMRKIDDVAKAEICSPEDPSAKLASLSWKRLSAQGNHSLLKVDLETGRMHQIRLQLSTRGWPVVGDGQYGALQDPIGVFGLHAFELSFRHPKSAKQITLTAPPPDSWKRQFPVLCSDKNLQLF